MYAGMLALALSLSAQGDPGVAGKVTDVKLAGSLFIMELEARGLGDDEKAIAKTLAELIATELDSKMDRKLITAGEVKELVDVETERAMSNCDDEGCLAEIAGALDAEFVLFGSVTKVVDRGILTLSLADRRGAIVQRESLTTQQLGDLVDRYPEAVGPIVAFLEGTAATASTEVPAEHEASGSPVLGLSVFGASTALAVVAGLSMWGGFNWVGDKATATQSRRDGQLFLWGSTIVTGASVAGMGVGVAMVMGE